MMTILLLVRGAEKTYFRMPTWADVPFRIACHFWQWVA
jgi:hypothetical protein